jgi:transposase
MTIHVEIADFSRFPSAPQFMSYVGLTPSEHSSGKSTNKGGLTKQGNAVVRTTLIECARNLVRGKVGYKTKSVTVRQKGQTAPIINYADKAVTRLQRKYQRMVAAGKPNNQVITAVARELAGFIWGMENHQINF